MLAVFGNAEGRAGQHRVGFERAKGGQNNRTRLGCGDHHVGEEVDDADIDIGHPAGMMIAQEEAQLIHYPRDWPGGVAIGAIEGRAGTGIEKSQPKPGGHYWSCECSVGCAQQPNRVHQEAPPVHDPPLSNEIQPGACTGWQKKGPR